MVVVCVVFFFVCFLFFFKRRTAYELGWCLEFRRVLFRSVDEPEMAELNRDHLGGDGPTDVLAFPVDDPSEVPEGLPVLLGDVVICPAVATRQATGGGLEAELSLLLVHGILHLLGHDHAEPDERSAMQETERRVLDGFSRS